MSAVTSATVAPVKDNVAFPLLLLYATCVPKEHIDEFWSTLFTQLASKISPPGLNISGCTLFSMKASSLSATPGGSANSSSSDMNVGSASILSQNMSQQKLSTQRGNAKMSILLMTTRGQMTLNKPRKGRLVNGSVAIQERGLGTTNPVPVSTNTGSEPPAESLRDLFPLKVSLGAQQFSVSLPTQKITMADLEADEVLFRLVLESYQLLKRLIRMNTALFSESDVTNQSSQMVERITTMRGQLDKLERLSDLKNKMLKEELLVNYCLAMKEQHEMTWTATVALRTTIELALASREHKSSDVRLLNGVVVGINDIEYDANTRGFVNRRWSKAVTAVRDPNSDDSDTESVDESDTESVDGSDTESVDGAEPKPSVSTTALKLMSQLEPSPLISPHHTIGLQRPGPRLWVTWAHEDADRLETHHDVARNQGGEKVDLIHAFERMVIAGNR